MSGNIYLGATEYSVGEREGFVTITIKRDGDTSKAVSVSYATNPDGATPGLDYTASSGNAVIAAGATSTTLRIPILNDALSEATESFNVSLINVDSGTLLFPRTTIVSILDDENPVVEPVNPPLVSDYSVKTVDAVTGLNGPMQIEWIEGSNIALVSEKEGRIKLVDFTTGKVVSTLLDITGKVNSDADRGLLDIALHPDLKNNPYLYAYYVADPADVKASGAASADNLGNRYAHLVRYELDMSGPVPTVKAGSETVMLGGAGKSLSDISGAGALDFTDPIHSGQRSSDMNTDGTYKQDYIKVDSRSHAGGAIAFGPDGALYVSTGDGTSYNYADPRTASVQNINSLSGKVLRIDPITGDGFADNPYATSNLDANASKVWQMGLRNPYAMTFTDDGRIMISETGWYSWEEINSGGKGANFGWPYYEGADNGEVNKTPGYQTMPGASLFYTNVANGTIVVTPAFRAFSHEARDPGHDMQAIVGGTTVYDGNKYPDIFKGDYFFSDIVDGDIFTVDVNDRTQLQFVTNIGTYHAVSFVQGPDGYVYYSDITGNKIVRLEIADPDAPPVNHAPVVTNPALDRFYAAGQFIDFILPNNMFTDPDGDGLNVVPTLANGQPLPSWLTYRTDTKEFIAAIGTAQPGVYDILVTAFDRFGAAVTDTFRLSISGTPTANQSPVLATPVADATAIVGASFSLVVPAGTFTDPNGDAIRLSAALATGQALPTWLTFDAATGKFSGTPPTGSAGSVTVRLTATDPSGAAVSDDFVLNISAPSTAETIVRDVASQNQTLTGATSNDVFAYAGASTLYQWGPSQDGKGIVVWTRSSTDNTFDVLTGFEKLRFSDRTVTLAEALPEGPDYADIADIIQELTGKTSADRFIVNGKSSDYAWGNTADGKGIVIWTVSSTDDTYDILTGFDQLVFTDKTVYLTGTPPANTAPTVANPVADQSATRGLEFSFAVPATTFRDADGDALTYSAKLASGAALPTWLKFDAATRLFSGTPPADANTISVQVSASDGKSGVTSDVFDIKLISPNQAPVLANPIADQTVAEDSIFNFTLPGNSFTDANGDVLQVSAVNANGTALPAWLSFSPTTRTFSGRPDDPNIGTLSVKVTANDGKGGTVSDTFDITVTPVNDAPTKLFPISNKAINFDETISMVIGSDAFYDVDSPTLTYSAAISLEFGAVPVPLPAWMHFDPVTRLFTADPDASNAGNHAIVITATDAGGLSAISVFNLTIAGPPPVQVPPVVTTPIPDQTINEGGALQIWAGSAFTDGNKDVLTYAATLADGRPLPAWVGISPTQGVLFGTPDDADIGTLAIKVTASDGYGGSISDTFNLTVTPVNDAPVLVNPIGNQGLSVGKPFSLTVPLNTFADPDDAVLTYSIAVTRTDGSPSSMPAWLKFDPLTRQLSGTPAAADLGVYGVVISATDASGIRAQAGFRIDVAAGAQDAPIVARAIPDQSVAEDSVFSYTLPGNTFSDANGDVLALTATLGTGAALPNWLRFEPITHTFTGMPPANFNGSIALAVTASDGKGGIVTDTFDLTVTPINDAPVLSKPIADATATAGTAYSFGLPTGTFTDVDNSTLTYSATLADGKALPSWLSLNAATGVFSGSPGDAQVGSLTIKVTAKDAGGLTASDEFKLTIGAKPAAETLYQNTTANEYIDAGDGKDVFVLGGNSSGYSWSPTQDGKGVVIWNDKGFDILFNFEELRFTNKTVTVASVLGDGSSDFIDDAATTQYVIGTTSADRFIIDGNAADYGWGLTQDGKGVVLWDQSGQNPHDILTNVEKLVFDDREVDISGLGQV